ncbi:regulator of microtubule dynamics protein 1 [Orussus abietinus]|uniref:regulator of microtubule dynamics protein 1 n=1 Tax=Orussus abietinus TaxID=222816 RepID=UPI000626397B|nr:regulator of microtubule dynamics protein 1 [Orussus abietinus]
MNNVHHSSLTVAAIGAAIGVIGAVSMLLYQKVVKHNQRVGVRQDLAVMNQKIIALEEDLKLLRQQSQLHGKKRRSRKQVSNEEATYTGADNEVDVDGSSIAGTDFNDDEFFDFSDVEESAGDSDSRASEAISELCTLLVKMEDEHEDKESYLKDVHSQLQEIALSHPDNAEIAWRIAKLYYICSNNTEDAELTEVYILAGLKACEKMLDTRNADLIKWYAILVGSHAKILPIKDQIEAGYRFKEYVSKALELNPTDALLHHMLGRFKFEVADLSWFKRKVAAALFAEPPSATYEEAIDHFKKAEELATQPHLENMLFLGKAYMAINQPSDAIELLKKLCSLPALTKEDKAIQSEAGMLL